MDPVNLHITAERLAKEVQEYAKILRSQEKSIPSSSESIGVPTSAESGIFTSDSGSLRTVRNGLLETTKDLFRAIQGPFEHTMTTAYASVDTANLGVILRFDIPRKVPPNLTISLETLADTTGLPIGILSRIIRFAIINGFFVEPEIGQIGHSAASSMLAHDENLYNVALFNTCFCPRFVAPLPEALSLKASGVSKPPAAAFNLAYQNYDDLFDFMKQHPDQSREYFNSLNSQSKLPLYRLDSIVHAFSWENLGWTTFVDIGGSSGHASICLAEKHDFMQFVVQDANAAGLEQGRAMVATKPSIKDRISFIEHDFFIENPTVSADVYFLRHILHDWSDDDCVKIIRALVPALKSGARVILCEAIIPEPPAKRSALLEVKQARIEDHLMLAAHSAKERSLVEFTTLFEKADNCFEFVGLRGQAPGVCDTFVEFKFVKT